MRLTRRTHRADIDVVMAVDVSVTVDFDRGTQTLGALQEAAYRLIGAASCRIEEAEGRFLCHLLSDEQSFPGVTTAVLTRRFLDLVTDENLREKISAETVGIRNVIVALAFGSLVSNDPTAPKA